MWMTPEVMERVPEFLRSPTATLEGLRKSALNGHQLVLDGFATLDAAINLLLVVSLGAAVVLLYVAARLRTTAQRRGDAL
jgi:hypothetical protein